jgi:hypothetical protein
VAAPPRDLSEWIALLERRFLGRGPFTRITVAGVGVPQTEMHKLQRVLERKVRKLAGPEPTQPTSSIISTSSSTAYP